MKGIKTYFFVLMMLIMSLSLSAQVKFGIRGGFQAGNIYNSGSFYDKGLNTYYAGIFTEFKAGDIFKFDVGLDFNQNGSNNDSLSINLSYISVPVTIKIKTGPVYGILGAAPSLKVAEKWMLNDEEINIDNYKSNLIDVPIFIGVGYKISIISIEARYYVGTMDINDNAISGLQNFRNQYLQLGLGLTF